MYLILHRILVFVYALLPVAAVVWSMHRSARTGRHEPIVSIFATICGGVIIGTVVVFLYAYLFRGTVRPLEVVTTWYWLVSLLLMLQIFRYFTRAAIFGLFRVPRDPAGESFRPKGMRASLASLCYLVSLILIGFPFMAAAILTSRVKVYSRENPATLANCDYETVQFSSEQDGRLSGWWVPADPTRTSIVHRKGNNWGKQTVLMCGGLGDQLASQPGLLKALVSDGYNVLVFDLRGHGDSSGHWTSFGDLERYDVLAALQWAKANHPLEATDVYALGSGIGGAAVIAAAASPGGEGIGAVAVYGSFARFSGIVQSFVDEGLPAPLRWVATTVMLPIASIHAGTDLSKFSPADLAPSLWPRPLLVIHGRGDVVIPFSEGEALFHAASFPRKSLWVPTGHTGAFRNRTAARVLLEFFDTARSIPAI